MKQLCLVLIGLPFLVQLYGSKKIPVKRKNTTGWVSLFNGKNLDNWTPKIAGYKLI